MQCTINKITGNDNEEKLIVQGPQLLGDHEFISMLTQFCE